MPNALSEHQQLLFPTTAWILSALLVDWKEKAQVKSVKTSI